MIRIDEIVESYKGLVGWKQGRTIEETIDEGLTTSDSGLYFQEANPLLTLRAMNGIKPEDATLDEYLEEMTERGIKKAVMRFLRDKELSKETKSIIDRRTLFDGAGSLKSRVQNSGKIVGFEITPLRANGVTTTLNKVGVQFVGNEGEIKLYLFHSSKSDPIATKTITYDAPRGSFMWFDLNWVIPYMTDSTNAGGAWYVVYYQNDLPDYMEAINFNRDWTREPCGTCNKGDATLYHLMNKYIQLTPFYVAEADWDEKLWDIEDIMYSGQNNYGLNFMFSMDCDLTDFFIAERLNFANVIQLEVAHEALRAMALNPEVSVNRVQYNADRDQILFETEGNGQGIKGLRGELDKAYKAIELNTKGLEPICLGCHNNGVKYRSI